MHYFEFGKRDTTLYSGGTTASRNTGLDEILEINKVVNNNGSVQNVSRVLIDFDLTYISESIQRRKNTFHCKILFKSYTTLHQKKLKQNNQFIFIWLVVVGNKEQKNLTTIQ